MGDKVFKLLHKKTISLIVIFGLIFVFSVLSLMPCISAKSGKTKQDRVSFLESLGLKVQNNSEKEKITEIPLVFSDVYNNYNDLQKEAGYDLKKYAGVVVKHYTYTLKTEEKEQYFAHLLVYKDRVIGGDVACIQLDGKMLPLSKKEIEKCLK